MQNAGIGFDRGEVAAQAIALAGAQRGGFVVGDFIAEVADGTAPVAVVGFDLGTHAAAHALHVGGHGFRDEVVVLGAGQFFQAVRLLVLADGHGGLAVETVVHVDIEEFVRAGVITDDPVPHARAFALQDQFGAAHAEVAVRAIDSIGAKNAEVVVVPVGIGLDEAFEGHFGATDDIDGVLGTGSVGKREQDGGGKQGMAGFHGESFAGGGVRPAQLKR